MRVKSYCTIVLTVLLWEGSVFAITPTGQPPLTTHAVPTVPVSEGNVSKPFDWSEVERMAKTLSSQPYAEGEVPMPEALSTLNYDQYRDIQYKPEKALWKDEVLSFQMQAFHRGFIFKNRIKINIVEHGTVTPLAYSPELFDYGKNLFPVPLPPDVGFAGLKLHYPLHRDATLDEIAVFLGASYFRALGLGQVYGLSARGIAIDTGLAKSEEFPAFREFWIEKPVKNATSLTLYAVLDGPSLSGAYRFIIRPGLDTTIEVSSHLYFRKSVERLGIAPLTSMFFHGENTDRFVDDVRPEVHDSDGLLIGRSTGEWMWRPLNNPKQLRVSVFADSKPAGFGLMKRDRQFDHYQDLDTEYHLRPSVWVEPLSDWGTGAIYLLEIPSDADKYDNIVAFWVPDSPTGEGKEFRYDYRLHFTSEEFTAPGGGKVVSTRIGGVEGNMNQRRFVVEFTSPLLKMISAKAQINAEVSAAGQVSNIIVQKNDRNGQWRLQFDVLPEMDKDKVKDPIEMRAVLKSGKDSLTETWVYQWNAR